MTDVRAPETRAASDSLRDVATAHKPIAVGRWLVYAVILILAANFVWICANNENFGWPVVAQWFADPSILAGLGVTLGLSVVAMAIGIVIGLLLAVARMSKVGLLRTL